MSPEAFLCVRLDGVDPNGGLLHPACVCWAVCASPDAFCSNAKRAFAGPLVQAFASRVRGMAICVCEWVFVSRVVCRALASMPGDVLLFQRLSVSTIGAVRFHGRVRDGIGWVTDAMVTKQWSERGHAHEWVLIDARAFCMMLR